jgi:hypothetical protein
MSAGLLRKDLGKIILLLEATSYHSAMTGVLAKWYLVASNKLDSQEGTFFETQAELDH